MTACKTCELVADRDKGEAPFWDCFYRTDYWDVVHKSETTLPGWLIVVAKRHLDAIDQLNEAEAGELGVLIHQTSKALKEVVGCTRTYVIQLAEHPDHPHVHFHVIPRMADISEDHRGLNVFNYDATSEKVAISDAEMNDIACFTKRMINVQAARPIERPMTLMMANIFRRLRLRSAEIRQLLNMEFPAVYRSLTSSRCKIRFLSQAEHLVRRMYSATQESGQ